VRSRIIAFVLVVLGSVLAVGWRLMILPGLLVAEAGARLTLLERMLVVAPMLVASALLIGGGLLGRGPVPESANVPRAVFSLVVVFGAMMGVIAIVTLVVMR
jgi:hypothetical protein